MKPSLSIFLLSAECRVTTAMTSGRVCASAAPLQPCALGRGPASASRSSTSSRIRAGPVRDGVSQLILIPYLCILDSISPYNNIPTVVLNFWEGMGGYDVSKRDMYIDYRCSAAPPGPTLKPLEGVGVYVYIYISCHFLKHMKHFLLKSCARRRASI